MRIVKNIFSAVIYVLIIAVGVLAAIFLISGVKPFCVQTGSMEPSYPVGSMIVVESVDAGQLDVGDVVTYSMNGSTVVTHRIVGIDKENRTLTTKGDNNNVEDVAAVKFENVIGRVVFCVPYVGYTGMILNTNFGRIMAIVVLFGIIGAFCITRMNRRMKDDEDNEDETTKNDRQK